MHFPAKKLDLLIEEIQSYGVAVFSCSWSFIRDVLPEGEFPETWHAMYVFHDDRKEMWDVPGIQKHNIFFRNKFPNYQIALNLLHELGHHWCHVKKCKCFEKGHRTPLEEELVSEESEFHAIRYGISECLKRKFYAPLIHQMRFVCKSISFIDYSNCRKLIRTSVWRQAEDLFKDELQDWMLRLCETQPGLAEFAIPELAEARSQEALSSV